MQRYKWLTRLAVTGTALFAGIVTAQDYPMRPIRLIVPFAPGGASDVLARPVAQKLGEAFGQQISVDIRAGAAGTIGMGIAANAAPDGYTVLHVTSSFILNPSLYPKVPYHPINTFIPISEIASAPEIFASHPALPATSIQELIKLMRGDVKRRSVSTPGAGTTNDLAAEVFRMLTSIDIVKVPYSSGGTALNAVMGNEVTVAVVSMPPAIPIVRSGRVRALIVTSPRRSASLPDVPTAQEAGLNLVSEGIQGWLVPAGTPAPIVARISNELQRLMSQPDMRERISSMGYTLVVSTPPEFATKVKTDVEKWGKVIKTAGIKLE